MNSGALQSKYVLVDGHRLHYLERGTGANILFVHGIPEHAGLYRGIINELAGKYRCIVPDHLGFGLSDKDVSADLSFAGHSQRLLDFIRALGLHDVHLVVHDLGGPIGIGALVQAPELFSSLTISNSFLWSLEGSPAGRALKMMDGWLGKWLYLNYGFSVKFMAKSGFARKEDFKKHYADFMQYHRTPADRWANYQLMLSMTKSGTWLDDVLQQLRGLDMPGQLIWGMKDRFFTAREYLARWERELPGLGVHRLEGAGHFPELEATGLMAQLIDGVIARFERHCLTAETGRRKE